MNTNISMRALAITAMASVAAISCIGATTEPPPADTMGSPIVLATKSTELATLSVSLPLRTTPDIGKKLNLLAGIMNRDGRDTPTYVRGEFVGETTSSHSRVRATFASRPGLHGRWESDHDSLELSDASVRGDHRPQATDVNEAKAQVIFERTYNSLVGEKLISPERAPLAGVEKARITAGVAALHETGATTWTDEYMYFVPLSLQGIRVGSLAQEYGITINVHRSGKVRRIELTGMAIGAGESGALTLAGKVRRATRNVSVDSWAKKRFGSAILKSHGLRYVVGEQGALVPREVHTVTTQYGIDGAEGTSKGFIVSYPVDSPTKEPVIWPAPGQRAPHPNNGMMRR